VTVTYYGLTFQPAVDRQQEPIAMISVSAGEPAAPRRAVKMLRGGGLIVFPVDQGYLVGCNALDARAVGCLCDVTGATRDRLLRFAADPQQERWLSGPSTPLAHPVPLALMRDAGLPLVATAVPPGTDPAPQAQHVVFVLGDRADLVLDAGPVRHQPVLAGR
jgi:tRNA A37 threonylcarbamoyladenosine synthetase subunit TsaC/SUA5/YrdC